MMRKIGDQHGSVQKTTPEKKVNPSRELIETLDVVKETILPFPPANLSAKEKIKITQYPHKTAKKAEESFQKMAKHFPRKG